MPTSELRRLTYTRLAVTAGATVVLVGGTVLALDRWGPGNMARGVATGALVGGVAAAIAIWRGSRRPDRATTGDRLFAGTADERDHALAADALAVLGVAAPLLTCAAIVAVALGSPPDVTLFVLLLAQVAVGAASSVRTWRRA